MVDSLVEIKESGFTTQYEVPSNNVLVEDGVLSDSALVECIAQSCALGFGYQYKSSGSSSIPIGFIGAVSKLEVFDTVKVKDILDIEISLISSFDVVQLVEGTIYNNGKKVINCQMKIVSP
jgi:predicted hotdog family 3-hydroxylacyl-ACP dehydratase